jgi:predicted kinase
MTLLQSLLRAYNCGVAHPRLSADVLQLTQALGPLPEPAADPVLVVVSGLPGTGKSYFSRKLAERLPCAIVESDAVRRRLFGSPTYSASESQRVFTASHSLIDSLLRRGIGVIFDATNIMDQHRQPLYEIAERRGVKLIMVEAEAPPGVVRERLEWRLQGHSEPDNSEADWSVYQAMRARRQRIGRSHHRVDTSRDIAPVIEKVVREARR